MLKDIHDGKFPGMKGSNLKGKPGDRDRCFRVTPEALPPFAKVPMSMRGSWKCVEAIRMKLSKLSHEKVLISAACFSCLLLYVD